MRRPSLPMALAFAALAGAAVIGLQTVAGRRSSPLPAAPAASTTWPPLSGAGSPPVASTPATAGPAPANAGLDDPLAEAGRDEPLVAHGIDGTGQVPLAPEPTFGTVADREAAATAPVHVATPIEPEPEEPLPIPRRPVPAEPGTIS